MGCNFSALPTKCKGCGQIRADFDRRYGCSECGSEVMYCGQCFDEGRNQHTETHKDDRRIKIIYHRSFLDKFFSGEKLLNGDASKSYNCVFCKKRFSAEELQLHLSEMHSNPADASALTVMLERMRQEDLENRIGEIWQHFG